MLSPRDKYPKKNLVIKNVSSSTSHKKLCLYVIRNSVIMSLREFKKIYFSWNEVWPQRSLKVTKGHKRPLLWQNHSGTFVYRPILLQICMITVFTLNYDLKCHFYVFTLRPSVFWPHYNLDLRSYEQRLSRNSSVILLYSRKQGNTFL